MHRYGILALVALGLMVRETSTVTTADDKNVRVTTVLMKPFVSVKEDKELTGNDRFEGFIPDLLGMLQEEYDWNMTIHLSKDNKYGERSGSTWSGMIGELVNDERDLAAASLTITDERKTAVDFAKPFMKTSLTAIMTPETAKEIDELTDLVNQTDVKYGIITDGSTKRKFTSTLETPYSKMWSQMAGTTTSVFVKSTAEGIKKVKESGGEYIFIGEKPVLDYESWKSDCELVTKWDFLGDSGYGFAVKKGNTELLKEVNDHIMKLTENGKLKELNNKWWKVATCSATKSQSLTLLAVAMGTVAAIFARI